MSARDGSERADPALGLREGIGDLLWFYPSLHGLLGMNLYSVILSAWFYSTVVLCLAP